MSLRLIRLLPFGVELLKKYDWKYLKEEKKEEKEQKQEQQNKKPIIENAYPIIVVAHYIQQSIIVYIFY